MSEVENHYGHEAGARPPTPRPTGPGLSSEAGPIDKVATAAARGADAVRGTVTDAYSQATDWASDSYETVSRNAVYARRRSAAEFNRGRRTVESFVEDNPVMVGVASLAAGLLVGALLPSTRQENRYLGRYADEVKNQGLRYAQDVAEQGRHALEENLRQVRSQRPPV